MGKEFNIEDIVGKSVILVHDSLTWAERVGIGGDTSLETLKTISRLGDEIIHNTVNNYSIKPLNVREDIYILSTPNGGGGHFVREMDYNYKKYDDFLNSLDM
ncbi:hypothetical protein KAJ38_00965 [Candidatus Pacearchaeota archaeon]|nr:hypothetical protein [Candidatus Pacearchaeota archaeon]